MNELTALEERLTFENNELRAEVERLRSAMEGPKHRLVLLESPYAGDVTRNEAYARAAMRDCLLHGEAPFASHLLYTQPGVLDDKLIQERELGISAGLSWGHHASATVVYTDLGISNGMRVGMSSAADLHRRIELRTLPNWGR